MILYLGIGLVASLIICRKNFDIRIVAFTFFLILSGMGSRYNTQYRIGNLMLGDIGLFVCFAINAFTSIRRSKIHKRTVYIILIAMAMFVLGVSHSNDFGNIFRDIKCYLYFFVSYVFCSTAKNDRKTVKCIIYAFLFVAGFTVFTNFRSFFTVGLSNLSSGKIDREFGLGLGAYYLVDVSVVLFAAQKQVEKIVGPLLYWASQAVLIFVCVVSYTRTVWIQFVIVYAFAILFKLFSSKEINIKSFLYAGGVFAVLIFTFYICVNSDNYVINLIMDRFTGIIDVAQDTNNESNTLLYRINDVKNNEDLYKNIQVIWGYGYGQLFQGTNGTQSPMPENSFLYYIVKYGVIGFCFLIYKVGSKLLRLFRSPELLNRVMALSLFIHMIVAAMSGNMNKYYSLPFIAAALCIDFAIVYRKDL